MTEVPTVVAAWLRTMVAEYGFAATVRGVKRVLVEQELERSGGKIGHVARRLGVCRRTVWNLRREAVRGRATA